MLDFEDASAPIDCYSSAFKLTLKSLNSLHSQNFHPNCNTKNLNFQMCAQSKQAANKECEHRARFRRCCCSNRQLQLHLSLDLLHYQTFNLNYKKKSLNFQMCSQFKQAANKEREHRARFRRCCCSNRLLQLHFKSQLALLSSHKKWIFDLRTPGVEFMLFNHNLIANIIETALDIHFSWL